MTLPTKPVVIRLSAQAADRFGQLCEEFAGLQKSHVMRCIVEATLSRELPEQVEIVTRQIRKPRGKAAAFKKNSERMDNLNTNRRLAPD